ncbi:MAG TPA: DUF2442 domain-containing protein [Thioploca sp.]|nr:DUF2442 domain-containing protein [Thioploca sp.]
MQNILVNIKLTFDNGVKKTADCSKWIKGGIFELLKDIEYFKQCSHINNCNN